VISVLYCAGLQQSRNVTRRQGIATAILPNKVTPAAPSNIMSTDSLHGLLEAAASHFPSKVAVEDPGHGEITYSQLNRSSTRISEELARAGVGSGDRVGLCAPKSLASVASLFGILKAGAAYAPVDPDAPVRRNASIFEDCSVKAVVVERSRVEALQTASPTRYAGARRLEAAPGSDIQLLQRSTASPDRSPETEDLAYVLYTSGSTGAPKGVMHTHRSALSFIDWCSHEFEPSDADCFSAHAPFHFDLSILDLYVSLKHGARLVLIGEQLGKQPLKLAPLISERKISVWYSTPSILRLLVEFGKLELHDSSSLRLVLFAGEVFPPKHQRALMARWPHPHYYNLFGPTETNVCTYYKVPGPLADDQRDPVPIGFRCSGDETLIVDENLRPVPVGTEGELLVSGGSVMVGYFNLEDRNREAFHTDEHGRRWYRTGDLVRDRGDGCHIFSGRRDRMVKRRGFRVELGEIEAALHRHPGVTEAAVIATPDEESGVLIRAFLGWAGAQPASVVELKRFSAENLPGYMIPDRFKLLESLPKTSTDKVDYQALKELA